MPSRGLGLSWSGLSKSFGRRALFANLSGELRSGQTLAVTGMNGSGKSTFLRIVVGLLTPDSGTLVRPPLADVGYCAPSLELYGDLTGLENLQFFAQAVGVDNSYCDLLLQSTGLSKAGGKLYSSYSSGMKQRLKLAFSLIRQPPLLVLDEPTIALDSDGVRIVDELIAQRKTSGRSTLIATNDQSEAARWADSRIEIGIQAW